MSLEKIFMKNKIKTIRERQYTYYRIYVDNYTKAVSQKIFKVV